MSFLSNERSRDLASCTNLLTRRLFGGDKSTVSKYMGSLMRCGGFFIYSRIVAIAGNAMSMICRPLPLSHLKSARHALCLCASLLVGGLVLTQRRICGLCISLRCYTTADLFLPVRLSKR